MVTHFRVKVNDVWQMATAVNTKCGPILAKEGDQSLAEEFR
jgi:hypothetical protein